MRACVDPSFAEKTLWPHSLRLGKAKLIVGKATNLNPEAKTVSVVTVDKQELAVEYDYLVIATGEGGGGGEEGERGARPSEDPHLSVRLFPSFFFFCFRRRAKGSNYATLGKGDGDAFGTTIPQHRAWFEATAKRIEKATSILFLGGGPVRKFASP